MPKNDLRIDILGTSFTISTEEDSEYLDKLLSKYRQTIENVQHKTGLRDSLKLAVLTGFLLCDDLEKAGTSPEVVETEERGEAERLALGMISRLDELFIQKASHGDTENWYAKHALEDHGEEEKEVLETPSPPCRVPKVRRENLIANKIYKLQNTVKNYDWGSAEWIPALLGQRNISRIPWAELWMGVHPTGPSRVVESGEEGTEPALLLSELIENDKAAFLGEEIARKYGKLPFLFKVLAAAKPLSIQVHPSREQAMEGFDRENRDGIPLIAPTRNYRDSNHKPEIICALGPFTALCGFRDAKDTSFLLQILLQALCKKEEGAELKLKTGFKELVSNLEREDENPYRAFIEALFCMEKETLLCFDLLLKDRQEQLDSDFPEYGTEWRLCVYLSSLFPGDPGVLAPLYLNIVELAQGDAMHLPAGVFHAYIYGMGIELMADSDNVLRGGLTSKHVDTGELLNVLQFSAYSPEILKVPDETSPCFSYPSQSEEFVLSVIHCHESSIAHNETGPSIVLVTEGKAFVSHPYSDFGIPLLKGESAFIPAGLDLIFAGTFAAYLAAPGHNGQS